MKTSDPVNILVVDDVPEKIVEIELRWPSWGRTSSRPNLVAMRCGRC